MIAFAILVAAWYIGSAISEHTEAQAKRAHAARLLELQRDPS